MHPESKSAFTLVELLVVIAIVSILVLMLLPAVNAMRESARRTQCMNNVGQLILAIQAHEMSHGVYPSGVTDSGGPILDQEQGSHHGWLIQLLPYLEESNLYRAIDPQVSVYHKTNQPARSVHVSVLSCPSSPRSTGMPTSNYAGVHHDVEAPIDGDNHGVLFLNSRLSHDDITDGTRYTLFIGEKVVDGGSDLGWMSGTRATLRNTGTPINRTVTPATAPPPPPSPQAIDNPQPSESPAEDANSDAEVTSADEIDQRADEPTQPGEQPGTATTRPGAAPSDEQIQALRRQGLYVGGFGSAHSGGAVFAFGHAHVMSLSNSIDLQLFQQLGHRADGKLLDAEAIDR